MELFVLYNDWFPLPHIIKFQDPNQRGEKQSVIMKLVSTPANLVYRDYFSGKMGSSVLANIQNKSLFSLPPKEYCLY